MARFLSRLGEALFLTVKSLTHWQVLGVNALVLDERGWVLLVRHRYQTGWRFPGGGVEIGETPEETLRHELAAEVGLEGGRYALLGIFTRRLFWLGHTVVFYQVEGMTGTLRRNWEIADLLWADPANPPGGLSPATARRLAEWNGAKVSRRW